MFIRPPGTNLCRKKAASLQRRNTALLILLTVVLLAAGCASAKGDFDRRLHSIIKPYGFSLLKWEFTTMANELKLVFIPGKKIGGDEVQIVREYFSLIGQIQALKSDIDEARSTDGENLAYRQEELASCLKRRNAMEDTVEEILVRQITTVLIDRKILNPLDNYFEFHFVFPPVNFEFEQPPHLLVISPRDRIELSQRILLSQNLSTDAIENIESQTDKLGVSSLVVELSGFAATYPATVVDNTDLRSTLEMVAEEWLHQYLAFRPLGFLYLLDALGIRESQDIATRNESLTGIVSKELGSEVYQRYYSEPGEGSAESEPKNSDFDFFREMREVRTTVDKYLEEGIIEQAEKFMDDKREYFASKGYYIRKLNQAYFAFHGIYAYDPASVSPVYSDLTVLRSESPSLKEFLDDVAWMAITPAETLAIVGALILIPFGVAAWIRKRRSSGAPH